MKKKRHRLIDGRGVVSFCSRSPLSLSLQPQNHTGRAGVPMEVMGLMLGEFVDDYTIRVADVFAMPQASFFVFFSFSRWSESRASERKKTHFVFLSTTHPQKKTVRHGRLGRGRRPGLPDADARHAAPGREARDGKFFLLSPSPSLSLSLSLPLSLRSSSSYPPKNLLSNSP